MKKSLHLLAAAAAILLLHACAQPQSATWQQIESEINGPSGRYCDYYSGSFCCGKDRTGMIVFAITRFSAPDCYYRLPEHEVSPPIRTKLGTSLTNPFTRDRRNWTPLEHIIPHSKRPTTLRLEDLVMPTN